MEQKQGHIYLTTTFSLTMVDTNDYKTQQIQQTEISRPYCLDDLRAAIRDEIGDNPVVAIADENIVQLVNLLLGTKYQSAKVNVELKRGDTVVVIQPRGLKNIDDEFMARIDSKNVEEFYNKRRISIYIVRVLPSNKETVPIVSGWQ